MNAYVRGSTDAMAMNDVGVVDDVVHRAQHGDVDAFESLYRAHSPAIYALCRRMVGTDGEALDLVQDIFVRARERLTTFRGQSALATWLHRLGVNVVLEHMRSSQRDAWRLIEGDDSTFGSRSPSAEIEAQIDLDAALAHLPIGARTV